MSAIKILLAEDNPLHASKMEMLLDILGYELVGVGATEDEVLKLLKSNEPDLLILDISLADNSDGVQIASKTQSIKPLPIIFATSFEDKATLERALSTNPYAYLIKPVEKGSLQAAIELAFKKFSQNPDIPKKRDEELDEVVLNDSFFVRSGGKLQKVKLTEVMWIEVAQDRYCDLVTADRRFQVRSSLSQLEIRLNPEIFLKIHRGTIVNMNFIDGVDEVDMVVEVGNHSLPLGGSYKNDLINRFRLL